MHPAGADRGEDRRGAEDVVDLVARAPGRVGPGPAAVVERLVPADVARPAVAQQRAPAAPVTFPTTVPAELTDPATADPEWLPWIGQLVGVNVNPSIVSA